MDTVSCAFLGSKKAMKIESKQPLNLSIREDDKPITENFKALKECCLQYDFECRYYEAMLKTFTDKMQEYHTHNSQLRYDLDIAKTKLKRACTIIEDKDKSIEQLEENLNDANQKSETLEAKIDELHKQTNSSKVRAKHNQHLLCKIRREKCAIQVEKENLESNILEVLHCFKVGKISSAKNRVMNIGNWIIECGSSTKTEDYHSFYTSEESIVSISGLILDDSSSSPNETDEGKLATDPKTTEDENKVFDEYVPNVIDWSKNFYPENRGVGDGENVENSLNIADSPYYAAGNASYVDEHSIYVEKTEEECDQQAPFTLNKVNNESFKRKSSNRLSTIFKRSKQICTMGGSTLRSTLRSSIKSMKSMERTPLKKSKDLLESPIESDEKDDELLEEIEETPKKKSLTKHPFINRSYTTPSRFRCHYFKSKYIRAFKSCQGCSKNLFGHMAVGCEDCQTLTHDDPICQRNANLPCVPSPRKMPKRSEKKKCTVADYVGNQSPLIPNMVVQCTNELERRGLNQTGLYRIPGKKAEIDRILVSFYEGRGLPRLANLDVHILTSLVKTFLHQLGEPLITRALISDFERAAESRDPSAQMSILYQAISELPQPNRDTLAWIVLHLQRIADSPDTQMTDFNLATVFAPTIVDIPIPERIDQSSLQKKTFCQIEIMQLLIKIESDYWEVFTRHPRSRRARKKFLQNQDSCTSLGLNNNLECSKSRISTSTINSESFKIKPRSCAIRSKS